MTRTHPFTAFYTLILLLLLASVGTVHAQCLLWVEPAATLYQGNVAVSGIALGSNDGLGLSTNARLGLSGDQELHVRAGGCGLSDVFGGALDLGFKKRILTPEDTNHWVSVSWMLSAVGFNSLSAGRDQVSTVGFVPAGLVSHSFQLSDQREGYVGLVIGTGAFFTDQSLEVSTFNLNIMNSS